MQMSPVSIFYKGRNHVLSNKSLPTLLCKVIIMFSLNSYNFGFYFYDNMKVYYCIIYFKAAQILNRKCSHHKK